jgi:enterochelin esterase-like enzyme
MLGAGCASQSSAENDPLSDTAQESLADDAPLAPGDNRAPIADLTETLFVDISREQELPAPDIDIEDAFTDLAAEAAADAAPDVHPKPVVSLDALLAALGAGNGDSIAGLMKPYDGPFCEGAVCLVVTWMPGKDAVALRGEWNGWAEDPMTASAAEGWFYGTVPAAMVTACLPYKLYAAGEWLRDPLNRWIRFADIAINSALCPPGASRIALVSGVYSLELDNSRDLYVYVPAAAFADPDAAFPVLYMQDGFNVFKNPAAPFGSWDVDLSADALATAGAAEIPIIVGIDTHDRLNEYLYAAISVDLGGGPFEVTPLLAEYAQFLVETVKPLVDASFPTRPGREDTAIAGSSLGGISSLWIAWHHADVFGRVASFSGSYWVGQEGSDTEGHPTMQEILASVPPTAEQEALRIYLDSGTDTGVGEQDGLPYTGDARCFTDWTRNLLISLGWDNRSEWDDDGNLQTPPADFPVTADPDSVPTLYWSSGIPPGYGSWDDYLEPERNLLHLVGEGHAHNEAAWSQRFPVMLRFLFPAK